MDAPDLAAFLRDFRTLADLASRSKDDEAGPTLQDALTDHLGITPSRVAVVAKEVVAHRYPDYDITLERMAGPEATLLASAAATSDTTCRSPTWWAVAGTIPTWAKWTGPTFP